MPRLSELQQKYPNARFEPHVHCPKCKGEGIWWHQVIPSEKNGFLESGFRCCMCIFVAPENLSVARAVVKEVFGKANNPEKES